MSSIKFDKKTNNRKDNTQGEPHSNAFPDKPPKKRFVSLKWKALSLLSIVFILIYFSFYAIEHHNLETEFREHREMTHARNTDTVDALQLQTALRLEQIGKIIPLLSGMEHVFTNGQSQYKLKDAFAPHWPFLQLDMELDGISFFDDSGALIGAWGNFTKIQTLPSRVANSVKQASRTFLPTSMIHCDTHCQHLSIVPIPTQDKTAHTIALSLSLDDIIKDVERVSGANIAAFTIPNIDETNMKDDHTIPNWDANIVAISRPYQTLSLLLHAAEKYSVSEILNRPQIIKLHEQDYELNIIPLDQTRKDNNAYIIIVEDISKHIETVEKAIKDAIYVGVIGLSISEAVLLFILLSPLSRLRKAALALPKLASSEFDAARAIIEDDKDAKHYPDETDRLIDSAITVSYQLETLEKRVKKNTRALTEKMSELQQERDFIRGLLDTAQIIVVTQNQEGKILLVNKHGQQLIGKTEHEIIGTDFLSLITTDKNTSEFKSAFNRLYLGEQENIRHEALVLSTSREKRTIAWLHSRLDQIFTTGSPLILSVGLDITEQKKAESRLSWLADHDHLTGLYNRRRFQREFEKVLLNANRYQHHGALLFLDLDNFKYINDTMGHPVGDAVIKSVSDALLNTIRATDIVARLGGDEFAIVLPEICATDAENVAVKINKKLSELTMNFTTSTHKVTSSIGIALFPEHGQQVDKLLANADIAMYQAKDHGRAAWHTFSEHDQVKERIERYVYWKSQTERALKNDGFSLFYQPIMSLHDGKISHYEALLRMHGENGEILSPASFIHIAENTGQIHDIEHWVLRSAVASLSKINQTHPTVSFSINLSAYAFSDPQILPLLRNLINKHHVKAENLIFEITETAAFSDFNAACKLMTSIRAMGCKFALDDFGVGFCSFYYLKTLPVDFIKIDGSFIRNLTNNSDDQLIVKAMSEFARGFGKKTIAEFVENKQTLELLHKYQVDFVQGYHIGKPAKSIKHAA